MISIDYAPENYRSWDVIIIALHLIIRINRQIYAIVHHGLQVIVDAVLTRASSAIATWDRDTWSAMYLVVRLIYIHPWIHPYAIKTNAKMSLFCPIFKLTWFCWVLQYQTKPNMYHTRVHTKLKRKSTKSANFSC